MIEIEQRFSHDRRKLWRNVTAAVVAWALVMAASLTWSFHQTDSTMLSLARKEAQANFNKDQAFRYWATNHGGVYVAVADDIRPNPRLSHIEERDVVTPSGRTLTLMNPAWMVRELMDEFEILYGVKGRITSLKPLNPNNGPDEWERRALLSFENGTKEAFELTEIAGSPYLRLMRPMVTKEGCLNCHADQGYKVGDIRGGVGVSVPLAPYKALAAERKRLFWASHGAIWLLGMAGIGWVGWRGRQRIHERQTIQQQIWRQANFDSLTGLANRNLFLDRLGQALAHAHRTESRAALLFIDLDGFKDINDTQGHESGDALLQLVARRVLASVRESDTVSRLGGDEFTVILHDLTDPEAPSRVAEAILEALSAPFVLKHGPVHVSASIGITLFPDDADDTDTLLKNADTAMYEAKAGGRATYRFFNRRMSIEAHERVLLEAELRRGLEQDEFVIYLQPIFTLPTRELTGAEVLLRWQHPQHGLIRPDRFIDAAERSGLIVPIGEQVIDRTVALLRTWEREGRWLPRLTINVSTRQCLTEGFLPYVQRLTRSVGPELTRSLTFEITESLYLGDVAAAEMLLARLRSLGITLAIDDFGTGYSSLAYLKRFPLDTLKIDRTFVRDIAAKPSDAALCEAIIAMAHHLGMTVIAEGVETEEQLAILEAQHCDKVQGFLLGRPAPPEQLAALLPRTARPAAASAR